MREIAASSTLIIQHQPALFRTTSHLISIDDALHLHLLAHVKTLHYIAFGPNQLRILYNQTTWYFHQTYTYHVLSRRYASDATQVAQSWVESQLTSRTT